MTFKDGLEIVEKLVTLTAVLVGGYWAYLAFIDDRVSTDHVILTQDTKTIPLNDTEVLLNVTVKIENKGQRLLKLTKARARVQQILPLTGDVATNLRNNEQLVLADYYQVLWPEICSYKMKINRSLEPNETEDDEYDFIVPKYLKEFRVYSEFYHQKPSFNKYTKYFSVDYYTSLFSEQSGFKDEDMVWHISSIGTLSSAASNDNTKEATGEKMDKAYSCRDDDHPSGGGATVSAGANTP